MEKAILKTLIYADLFEYPLKAWEIHKWLVGKKSSMIEVEKELIKLIKSKKIQTKKELYFLKRKEKLVAKRIRSQKVVSSFLRKVKLVSYLLRIIPTVKLIGVSGGLALDNVSKKDDIDLFIITKAGTLWFTRLMVLGVLDLISLRRKRSSSKREAAGKICVNILLDENNLEQKFKDIYIAHEILQMKILYQKDNVYSKFLEDNLWVFEFLPNWASSVRVQGTRERVQGTGDRVQSILLKILEQGAKRLQLKIMGAPEGLERIQEGSLYFLPEDYRNWVLKAYVKKLKRLSLASSNASFKSSKKLPS